MSVTWGSKGPASSWTWYAIGIVTVIVLILAQRSK